MGSSKKHPSLIKRNGRGHSCANPVEVEGNEKGFERSRTKKKEWRQGERESEERWPNVGVLEGGTGFFKNNETMENRKTGEHQNSR